MIDGWPAPDGMQIHTAPKAIAKRKKINTEMQENTWARLRDSHPGKHAIHATQPTHFLAYLYVRADDVASLRGSMELAQEPDVITFSLTLTQFGWSTNHTEITRQTLGEEQKEGLFYTL